MADTTPATPRDSDEEEEVLVCGICREILLGTVGGPDTLLEHMATDHERSLSPENFTKFTLKVAQETGFPDKCFADPITSLGWDQSDSDEDGERTYHAPKYHSTTVQDGPWCDLEDPEAWETGIFIMTKDGMRIMDRGVFLDKHTGQQILGQHDGDPSHSSWQPVNTLKEKAASIAGCLLTRPEDLAELQIPTVLKKLVGCWNHRIYRHRHTREVLRMGPEGCPVCCKGPGCKACCDPPTGTATHTGIRQRHMPM